MGNPSSKNSPSSAPKLDVGLIKTFVQAALHTFKVQCSFEAKAGKSFQKGKGPELEVSVAGVIGITSATFKGSLAICFPEKTYLKIMSGMLGEDYQEMNDDIRDGAGELVNIILGCAKKALSDGGYVIDRAIPSISHGKKVQLKHVTSAPVIVIPFESLGGPFQIEIVLE